MRYYPKIIGERIYLSPINLDEDITQYTKWMNDNGITDNLGVSGTLYNLEKEKAALEEIRDNGYCFAVIRKEGDVLLGNVGFLDVNHIHRNAECGLFIGEIDQRNLGYGKEALRLLLRYGFDVLNFNNVMLHVFSFNRTAIACYEKVGFRKAGARRQAYFLNGEYHDELWMDILSEEFHGQGK
ncbi:MAG: GNAT family N-acetyltransferase [Clostridiales Family XIII bacterium]|jgi:RimJ/RimL family protein N-acetyltransferase|nr:GNAT family N-acetyltransferase [Clostridiales Family XIII bacterium]